ncbi:MAG: hypothetical protein FIB01_10850 [Gemmatimonadetes bacterium]|nr:hypothetical protein [Gemmatimonadota bacterium]
MIGWWKKQRLEDPVRRRLLFALARAEEELIETHVQNALDVVDAVGDSLTVGRALELYLEALEPEEPRATIIAKRVLARLEREDAERARRRKRRRRSSADD